MLHYFRYWPLEMERKHFEEESESPNFIFRGISTSGHHLVNPWHLKWNNVWCIEISYWNNTEEYGIVIDVTCRCAIILTIVCCCYKNSGVVSFLTEVWTRELTVTETLECTSKNRFLAPPHIYSINIHRQGPPNLRFKDLMRLLLKSMV